MELITEPMIVVRGGRGVVKSGVCSFYFWRAVAVPGLDVT